MSDWSRNEDESEAAPPDFLTSSGPVTPVDPVAMPEPDPVPMPEPTPMPEPPPAPEPVPVEPVPAPPIDPVPAPPTSDVAFDLTALSVEARKQLSDRMNAVGIDYRFQDAEELFVPVEAVATVQGFVDDAVELAAPPEPEPLPLVIDHEEIEETIDEADEDADEIVFDLASLSSEERRHLTMRLTGAGISHIWEVATDLVVSVEDAPLIERYVEEVRNPDGFGDDELADFDEDSDVDDEAVYAAMSNLYVAADKLMQKPGDDANAGNFYLAADDVEGLPAPFGFDPRVWQQVLSLAESITTQLDAESDTEVIGNDARTLRQLLVNYV